MLRTSATVVQEGLFDWKADPNGARGRCWVRVIPLDDFTVVIVSEIGSNPGPSICNAFESLFPAVVEACDLNPMRICWIEHWGPFSSNPPQPEREVEYHQVLFRLEEGQARNPSWQFLSEEKVEKILGAPIPEFQAIF